MVRRVKVFVSYSHKDEALKLELDDHLSSLKQSDTIAYWHDRNIGAGTEWAKEIDQNLNSADIILLLISASFISSRYCWGIELKRAMERHEAGNACVIPIVIRPAVWKNTPIAKLQAFPKDAKAITSWANQDEAFVNVVEGIQAAVDRLSQLPLEASPTPEEVQAETAAIVQEIVESGQGEAQYREEVLFLLTQDCGEISPDSRIVLEISRKSFQLSVDRATAIETAASRPLREFREAAIALIPSQGTITSRIQSLLDRVQQRLNLSDENATAIVENILSLIEPSLPEPTVVVPPKPALPAFSFEVLTVNDRGKEIDRRSKQASYLREELAKGIFLDMISIPGGTFWMGTAEEALKKEQGSEDHIKHIQNEKPRRQVAIEPFYMGKVAVTQAQWKAIATLPKIDRDLKPDPSHFKGANRPVEQISWDDAIEFCGRLTQKTGKQYRLPSEAEWEYACRAGTTTPFHFGETITTELVNYNGNYTHAKAPKGTYREQTIEVESFSSNAFGLYQMHGNVWEWCDDPYHESYEDAPTDGRAWKIESDQENTSRVLRGGSWGDVPGNCRSAIRGWDRRDYSDFRIGFRLALSCPRIP